MIKHLYYLGRTSSYQSAGGVLRVWIIKFLLFLPSLLCLESAAQSVGIESPLNVFINCRGCDQNYIRAETPFVDFVRDQALSDVQVFITRIRVGSGGSNYTLTFTGFGPYQDISQELFFEASPILTRDEIRSGLLKRIQIGLLTYLSDQELLEEIDLVFPKEKFKTPVVSAPYTDPWKSWIFRLYAEGRYESEAQQSEFDAEAGIRANKVTEDWRIRTQLEFNHFRQRFDQEDDDPIISTLDRNYFRISLVRSISNHWSAGIFADGQHNTFQNFAYAFEVAPAIEYSIFDYEAVARRELTFAYRLGYRYNNYIEMTIFDKDAEGFIQQTLEANMRYNQPWGFIFARLRASNFLKDWDKNSVRLNSDVSIRIIEGLGLRFSIDMALIRNQINLPKRDISLEELLTAQRLIATNFEIGFGMGVTFTFGSTFNSVVNTRL